MVEELVREFVPCEFATGLDFRGLQRVNPKFHPNRRSARRREGDVIWRLPTRDGGASFLYLLIEFQRESDAWMAVRTQVYQGLLWQQVIDERRLRSGARLPPLLLLVLYNGAKRWNATSVTSELIALSPDSSLWPWQPQVRYRLLDMGSFPKDDLVSRSSLVALLFRLEQPHSPDELKTIVGELNAWFRQHPGYERLRALFAELIRESCVQLGMSLSESDNLLEEKTMLVDTFRAWQTQWFAEGKAEGKAEGEAKGKAEGKAEALTALLVGRFGTVAPSWQQQIHAAELATLDRWFERAIDAPDLPSVFNPPL